MYEKLTLNFRFKEYQRDQPRYQTKISAEGFQTHCMLRRGDFQLVHKANRRSKHFAEVRIISICNSISF